MIIIDILQRSRLLGATSLASLRMSAIMSARTDRISALRRQELIGDARTLCTKQAVWRSSNPPHNDTSLCRCHDPANLGSASPAGPSIQVPRGLSGCLLHHRPDPGSAGQAAGGLVAIQGGRDQDDDGVQLRAPRRHGTFRLHGWFLLSSPN